MSVKELILKRKQELNIMISLSGVIPMLVLVYILIGRVASIDILIGNIGYIMLCTVLIFMLGISVGKKMFISIINELVEKNRLAAVTETALALSHEINNPLLAVRGNLDLLESDFSDKQVSDQGIINRLDTIKTNCERIRLVTEKLTNLSQTDTDTIHGSTRMVDLSKSN